jgi:hypothetical protein
MFIGTVEFTEPLEILASADITHATCTALTEDGAIEFTVTGGTGGFTFLWSNGAVTKDLTGVEAGHYRVIVEDESSCQAAFEYDVLGLNVATAYAGIDDTICPASEYQLIGSVGDSVHWEPR